MSSKLISLHYACADCEYAARKKDIAYKVYRKKMNKQIIFTI